MVAENVWNKQSWTADKGITFDLGQRWGLEIYHNEYTVGIMGLQDVRWGKSGTEGHGVDPKKVKVPDD